jgi:hypothetical protein
LYLDRREAIEVASRNQDNPKAVDLMMVGVERQILWAAWFGRKQTGPEKRRGKEKSRTGTGRAGANAIPNPPYALRPSQR